MPKHLSVEKRARTNLKRQSQNVAHLSRLKTEIKKLRELSDPESAAAQYQKVESLLDKGAKRGNLHHRNASRHKSRLARGVNRLSTK